MSGPSRRRPSRGGRKGFEPRAVVAEREERAWDLSLRGKHQREIAAALGISQPAVSKMLRRRERRLVQEDAADLRRRCARVHAQLQAVVRDAFDGFERSQRDRRRKRRTDRSAPGQPPGWTTEITAETSPGDPRFLREANQALATTITAFRYMPTPTASPPPRRLDLARLTAEEWDTYQRLYARVTAPTDDAVNDATSAVGEVGP